MKNRYLRRRNAFVRRPSILASAVIAVAVLLLLIRVIAPSFFMTLASPALAAGSAMADGVAGITSVFRSSAALTGERNDAIAAEASLAAQNQVLQAKVADLTALLGTRADAPPGIVAGVIARPPLSPYDELLVDAGSSEGVIAGAQVFGAGGLPAGTVASVTAHAARVALYSTAGRTTDALAGASRQPVILAGAGAGAFTASVPRDAGTAVGDTVYISGPGSLPIGTVSAIDSDPSSPTATLHITPMLDPFTITWVTIAPAP